MYFSLYYLASCRYVWYLVFTVCFLFISVYHPTRPSPVRQTIVFSESIKASSTAINSSGFFLYDYVLYSVKILDY